MNAKRGDVLRAVEQRGEPALREDQRVEDDGDERDRRKGDQRDEQGMRGKDKMVADMHDEQRGRKRTDQLGKQDAQQDAHDQGERADDHRLEDEDDGHAAALHAQDMIRTEFLTPPRDQELIGIQDEETEDEGIQDGQPAHDQGEIVQDVRNGIRQILCTCQQAHRSAGIEAVKQRDRDGQRQKVDQIIAGKVTDVAQREPNNH